MFTVVVTLFAVTLPAKFARADIPPDDAQPCRDKEVGDACEFRGRICTCQRSEYGATGYLETEDAGLITFLEPASYVGCLDPCEPAGTAGTGSTPEPREADAAVSPATQEMDASVSLSPATQEMDASVSLADETEDRGGDDSGCSVSRSSRTGRFVPWALAASFSLLFLVRRRRRG
jgi:hypothetical protein